MIRFLLKKTLYDAGDRLGQIAASNLVGLALGLPAAYLAYRSGLRPNLALAASVAPAAAYFAWLGATASMARSLGQGRPMGTGGPYGLKAAFMEGWLPGLQYGLLLSALLAATFVALPFYLAMDTGLGTAAAGLLLPFVALAALSLQYFLPVRMRFSLKLGAALKQCLLLALDNPGFSVFLLIWTTATFLVSALAAFILPGTAAIQLSLAEALRLRMLKYAWLEAVPGRSARGLPWADILAEERHLLDKRTFRSVIFPWKS